jgi:hypothetical protein
MRFFINFIADFMHNELQAYSIEPDDIYRTQIRITAIEAESFIDGGVWAIYRLKHERYASEIRDNLIDFHKFGILATEEEGFYTFQTVYIRNGATPSRIKLPDKSRLAEIGLV